MIFLYKYASPTDALVEPKPAGERDCDIIQNIRVLKCVWLEINI
jgi:hypothetical protein